MSFGGTATTFRRKFLTAGIGFLAIAAFLGTASAALRHQHAGGEIALTATPRADAALGIHSACPLCQLSRTQGHAIPAVVEDLLPANRLGLEPADRLEWPDRTGQTRLPDSRAPPISSSL